MEVMISTTKLRDKLVTASLHNAKIGGSGEQSEIMHTDTRDRSIDTL